MRITVLGGTGYAGAAIVAEAVGRGHDVTSFSRSQPASPVAGARVVLGDVAEGTALEGVVGGADVVVGALAPRGPLADSLRDVYRTTARLADEAHARLVVVGGFSSLRPAKGADRYSNDLSSLPAEYHDELLTMMAVVVEDLPATPESLDWVFVSPAMAFGAQAPGERTGRYRLGDDVAVDPQGGAISGADYAVGVLDLIEAGGRRRAHVNLGY